MSKDSSKEKHKLRLLWKERRKNISLNSCDRYEKFFIKNFKKAVGTFKNKIIAGIQNGQPEYAEKMIKKGFQLVTIGSDQRYMAAASKAALGKLKKDTKKDPGKGY